MSATIEDKIYELVNPIVESKGLILWGVRYRGGQHKATLHIYIDKEDGVNADTCGEMMNILSPTLDVADIIAPAYILEVSSPGLDRILFNLEQARKYIGSKVKAELRTHQDGRKKFEGKLLAVDENIISIEDTLSSKVDLVFSNIATLRLVPEFKINKKN